MGPRAIVTRMRRRRTFTMQAERDEALGRPAVPAYLKITRTKRGKGGTVKGQWGGAERAKPRGDIQCLDEFQGRAPIFADAVQNKGRESGDKKGGRRRRGQRLTPRLEIERRRSLCNNRWRDLQVVKARPESIPEFLAAVGSCGRDRGCHRAGEDDGVNGAARRDRLVVKGRRLETHGE